MYNLLICICMKLRKVQSLQNQIIPFLFPELKLFLCEAYSVSWRPPNFSQEEKEAVGLAPSNVSFLTCLSFYFFTRQYVSFRKMVDIPMEDREIVATLPLTPPTSPLDAAATTIPIHTTLSNTNVQSAAKSSTDPLTATSIPQQPKTPQQSKKSDDADFEVELIPILPGLFHWLVFFLQKALQRRFDALKRRWTSR